MGAGKWQRPFNNGKKSRIWRRVYEEFIVKARPVYLHKDERIKAHFIICYLSLLIYRILEKEKLQDKYTTQEIITTLKEMITNKIEGIGYKQLYEKTTITTDLNNNYDFNLDKEFIGLKNMKKILKS